MAVVSIEDMTKSSKYIAHTLQAAADHSYCISQTISPENRAFIYLVQRWEV